MNGELEFEIEISGILNDYEEEDIKIFVYDLFLVFNIYNYLEKEYGSLEGRSVDRDVKKFEKLINDWNLKYEDIILKLAVNSIEYKLKVFIKEDIKNLAGLIKKMNRFISLKQTKDKIVAAFEEFDMKENTLTLKEEQGMARLIYLKEDMLHPKSPEFRICTYHAMKGGFRKDIELQKYADEFSFDIEEEASGGEGWFRRYPSIEFISYKRSFGG